LQKNKSNFTAAPQSSHKKHSPDNRTGFIRDASENTLRSIGRTSSAAAGKYGAESTKETFVRAVTLSKKQDPKLRKQNEVHFKQCIDILDGVQGYLEQREEKKSIQNKFLSKMANDRLIFGLPELAQT